MMNRIAIGLLSAVGFLISGYFASIYHNIASFVNRNVPKSCRIEPSTCSTLLRTPESRLFGIPNFDLGILYYASLFVSAMLPTLWNQLHTMLIFGSATAAATGFYLTYVLVFRLHLRCVLCIMSHAINILIFFLLLGS